MPSTGRTTAIRTSPISPASPGIQQQPFDFPLDSHLVITTPSQITAWDSSGIHLLFNSSQSGIVAAQEAKDGSGLLAVADKRVVVLHDTKRGQERSWGLRADKDQVRNLQYTQDAKTLFLSTSSTTDIQRYSTERSRLLSPAQHHASPPDVLAISPTGRLMVSASDSPPVVYLNNLEHNNTPVLIEPRASNIAVCVASFHPDRPNIFLLAFRDGTLAAYDASKIMRRTQGSFSNQECVNDGEIGRFQALHRTTSKAVTKDGIVGTATSIADAAFLPGFKTRAVSVGGDGRCRLVDFADGGVVLRTWHAKAPVTSLSILSIKTKRMDTVRSSPSGKRRAAKVAPRVIGGPTSTDAWIAIGRADGKVNIYDMLGLLLAQKTVGERGEKVISVEWVTGPTPRPLAVAGGLIDSSPVPTMMSSLTLGQVSAISGKPTPRKLTGSNPRHLGLPQALRRVDDTVVTTLPSASRRFTIHPDELAEGTVRYRPSPEKLKPVALPTGGYLDLFSPVKPHIQSPDRNEPEKRLMSPPRSRARLSSKTFVRDPTLRHAPLPVLQRDSHATSSGSATPHVSSVNQCTKSSSGRHASTTISLLEKHRSAVLTTQSRGARGTSIREAHIAPNKNARILADLRKLSSNANGAQRGSLLPPSVQTRPDRLSRLKATTGDTYSSRPFPSLKAPARQKAWHPGNVLEREATWPTDSVQDSSDLQSRRHQEDIWLTSASDHDGHHRSKDRRHRRLRSLQHQQRPPTRLDFHQKGTLRNASPTQPPAELAPDLAPPGHTDGSTDAVDEETFTARTHLSSAGLLSPASDEVRELFPRTSSLSPRRRYGKRSPKPEMAQGPLSEVKVNRVAGIGVTGVKREDRSPRVKAKAVSKKGVRGEVHVQVREDEALRDGGDEQPKSQCLGCAGTNQRVLALEDEVARLKGEVLALKAVLRRTGVRVPPSLR